MLSTVRLTWCIMDTVDGAVRRQRQCVKDETNQSLQTSQSRTESFTASLISQPNTGFCKGVIRNAIKSL